MNRLDVQNGCCKMILNTALVVLWSLLTLLTAQRTIHRDNYRLTFPSPGAPVIPLSEFLSERRDRSRLRSPRRHRDRSRDSHERWSDHRNELVLNATQVAESAALKSAAFSTPQNFLAFSENGQHSSQAAINAMTVHAEAFLVRNHPNLARNWTPQRCTRYGSPPRFGPNLRRRCEARTLPRLCRRSDRWPSSTRGRDTASDGSQCSTSSRLEQCSYGIRLPLSIRLPTAPRLRSLST